MALVDPTGGIGYSFGQKLPSTHMTTIAQQQPNAIDGVGGGTYTPAAPLVVNGITTLKLEVLDLKSDGKLKYVSRSVTRQQSYTNCARTLTNQWALHTNDAWINVSPSGGFLSVSLDRLAHGAVMTDWSIRWKGGAGHGALPTILLMPKFEAFAVNTESQFFIINTVSDTSASVAAYETEHTIVIPMLVTVNLDMFRYVLKITSESGAAAQPNAQPLSISATMTVTEQAEV